MRVTYFYKGLIARRRLPDYYEVTKQDNYVGTVFKDIDGLWQPTDASDTDLPKSRTFMQAFRLLARSGGRR